MNMRPKKGKIDFKRLSLITRNIPNSSMESSGLNDISSSYNMIINESGIMDHDKNLIEETSEYRDINIVANPLRETMVEIIVEKPLNSINLSNCMFTNFLKSNSITKRDEVKTIKSISNKKLMLLDIPIDFEDSDYLDNAMTDNQKHKRYCEVFEHYERLQGKFAKNYLSVRKYRFINDNIDFDSPHRIIGHYDRFAKVFHIFFLDPHHLLATSNFEVGYYNRKGYRTNICDI